ncbi:MAG: transporter substrate-binding domain-containing protein [Pseudomonadota bacterium]
MRTILVTLAVMLSLVGGVTQAGATVLRIATGQYVPFTDENQPDGGIVNEYVQRVAEAAGYSVEFEYQPWMRALELTRTGRYVASSYWFFNEDRETEFIHVGPVVADRLVLFRRADTELPEWSDVRDLSAFRIGAVTGYTYTDGFWEMAEAGELQVQTAQSDEANLRKLVAGRIDVYPMSEEVGLALLRDLFTEEQRAQIVTEPEPLIVTKGYLLVSRQTEGGLEVAARLQQEIDELGVMARSEER